MGDSSVSQDSCLQCMVTNTSFRKGWRFRNGNYAQLCHPCYSLYEQGKFCGTFHSQEDGWRDCKLCGKLMHCGCIASRNKLMLLDFGGVICMECWRIHFMIEPKLKLFEEAKTENKKARSALANGIQIKPQYWPRFTASELDQVVRKNSSVSPLFEKILSATDVDQSLGRLIVPRQCAEAYFPKITFHTGCPILILDADGKEWNFRFRYWVCLGHKAYVLEGLKEFMVSKQWHQGDVVTFFRTEPGKKLVMGLRKTHFCQPPSEVQGSSERDDNL